MNQGTRKADPRHNTRHQDGDRQSFLPVSRDAVSSGQSKNEGKKGCAGSDNGAVQEKSAHRITAKNGLKVVERGLKNKERRNRRVLDLSFEGPLDHPGKHKKEGKEKDQQKQIEGERSNCLYRRMFAPGVRRTGLQAGGSGRVHHIASEAARLNRIKSRLVPITRMK